MEASERLVVLNAFVKFVAAQPSKKFAGKVVRLEQRLHADL
jgi:hypothetical protein